MPQFCRKQKVKIYVNVQTKQTTHVLLFIILARSSGPKRSETKIFFDNPFRILRLGIQKNGQVKKKLLNSLKYEFITYKITTSQK